MVSLEADRVPVHIPCSAMLGTLRSPSTTAYFTKRYAKLWFPPETQPSAAVLMQSDVWSFGVTCWEVFSQGRKPWSKIRTGNEVTDYMTEQSKVPFKTRRYPRSSSSLDKESG